MLDKSEAEAVKITAELQEMRMILEAEGDQDSNQFLKVLQVLALLTVHRIYYGHVSFVT